MACLDAYSVVFQFHSAKLRCIFRNLLMIQGSIVQVCVVVATLSFILSLFFQSNIYWFQFVRDELLLGDDWSQQNQSSLVLKANTNWPR